MAWRWTLCNFSLFANKGLPPCRSLKAAELLSTCSLGILQCFEESNLRSRWLKWKRKVSGVKILNTFTDINFWWIKGFHSLLRVFANKSSLQLRGEQKAKFNAFSAQSLPESGGNVYANGEIKNRNVRALIDALKHQALAVIQRVFWVCFAFAARIFRSFQSESKHTHVFRMNSLKSIRKSAKSDVTIWKLVWKLQQTTLRWHGRRKSPSASHTADP